MAEKFDRIIIGAGAAGLYAAATSESEVHGLILDRSHMPGLKFLLSGSGQCNITHGGSIKEYTSKYGEKGKKIRSILYGSNNYELMEFIEGLGVKLFERTDGKIFPKSLKASEVVGALVSKAKENGFEIHTDEGVTGISKTKEGFCISTVKGEYYSPLVIVTTGGKSYPKTGSDGSMFDILMDMGIEISELKPALSPIYVHGYKYKSLSGISFKNAGVLITDNGRKVAENSDDILLTHRGFSGPGIMDISRYADKGMKLVINYLGNMSSRDAAKSIKERFQTEKKLGVSYISKLFGLPLSFVEAVFDEIGIDTEIRAVSLKGDDIERIADAITYHEYDISGIGGFSDAMVTSGGVSLDEINVKNMESIKYPGLFFAGEVLDVDGDTGGYNLQFAYSGARTITKYLK